MVSAVLFITFFVLLVLNVPISICLGLSSAAAILYSGTSLTIVATNIYSGISKFLLLAIPFFVLSGNIMAKAGISTRLIRFVNTCVEKVVLQMYVLSLLASLVRFPVPVLQQ